jgi:hemerythrin-like domain-containing protein
MISKIAMIDMGALEVLVNEHEVILKIVEVLNNSVEKLHATEKVSREFFEKILDVMRNFVEKCHHGKEEMALFPLIRARGGREAKAVSLLIEEHEKGRVFVKALDEAVKKNARDNIIKSVNGYVGLLAQHVKKENVVFPTWINSLSDETKNELFKRFEEIEERFIGLGKHQEYIQTVETLKNRID